MAAKQVGQRFLSVAQIVLSIFQVLLRICQLFSQRGSNLWITISRPRLASNLNLFQQRVGAAAAATGRQAHRQKRPDDAVAGGRAGLLRLAAGLQGLRLGHIPDRAAGRRGILQRPLQKRLLHKRLPGQLLLGQRLHRRLLRLRGVAGAALRRAPCRCFRRGCLRGRLFGGLDHLCLIRRRLVRLIRRPGGARLAFRGCSLAASLGPARLGLASLGLA